MKSPIALSQFRVLAYEVQDKMLQGELFTKSDLNALIPEGMDKSADDIIRLLQEKGEVAISHQREKKGAPAYWYVKEADCEEFKHFPGRHRASIKARKDKASIKHDTSAIQSVYKRRGFGFTKEAILSLYQ